jgi:hypothetical protein
MIILFKEMCTDRATADVGEVSAKLAVRSCCVVTAADPYDGILDFIDRNRYCFYQVAPHLYSRG